MTVYIRNYQKNGETKALVLESPNQYAVVFRAEKGKLKDAHVFDRDHKLAAEYKINGNEMTAKGYGKTTFGGAFASKETAALNTTDHSHLYLESMDGWCPFDMGWHPDGRLSLYFGETSARTIGDLHLNWNGKIVPQLEKRYPEHEILLANASADSQIYKSDQWIQKVEQLAEPTGMSGRLTEITLEKKAKVLDDWVAKDKKEDEKFIKEYLEVDAARNGSGKVNLKDQIIAVKNKTEKKRFEKYKTMSAEKLADPEVQKKLAEIRAKREGR